nr:hypothetical protein Iba_chr14aCG21590 [Ipomoea batatas]
MTDQSIGSGGSSAELADVLKVFVVFLFFLVVHRAVFLLVVEEVIDRMNNGSKFPNYVRERSSLGNCKEDKCESIVEDEGAKADAEYWCLVVKEHTVAAAIEIAISAERRTDENRVKLKPSFDMA